MATSSAAPSSPVAANPARAPLRRTTHIDIRWVDEGLVLSGVARDLASRAGGVGVDGARVLGEASLLARVGRRWELRELRLDPCSPGSEKLLGKRVRSGFRAEVRSLMPGVGGTPVGLLLDDVPGAALISGYVNMRADIHAGRPPAGDVPRQVLEQMVDICSGWRSGGTAIAGVKSGAGIPAQDCPVAPDLDRCDDPLAWHAIAPLAAGSMRRRRRIDVFPDETVEVDAMFRDTFGDPDGTEVVLHEYTLQATLRRPRLEITRIEATPRVLPFGECPFAADLVEDLVGSPVGALRSVVPEKLNGTRSCTHLNDLLRVMADVDTLVGHSSAQAPS